jgi:uncharacterized damage-inducible protein DinB
MTPALYPLLADYNRWMNGRVYDAAASLSSEALFQDRHAFFGSLFDTLNHIAVADVLWLHRLVRLPGQAALRERVAAYPVPVSLRQRLAPDLASLRALRTALDALIVEMAGRLTDADAATTLQYRTTDGREQTKTVGLVLMHVFNHQTHHRGQASTLLFQAGVDVGVTDLNALIPEVGPAAA